MRAGARSGPRGTARPRVHGDVWSRDHGPAPVGPALSRAPSLSPSLPLPPRPGPAHPPPRRLPEAQPGRAAGGRVPTAGQTGAREDGQTDTRRAAGTHGPGRCSEARPGGLGPRSGEVTATRARKGWARWASAVPARLAQREGGAARARRGKMAPAGRGARPLCGPGPEPPRPPRSCPRRHVGERARGLRARALGRVVGPAGLGRVRDTVSGALREC